MPERDEAEQERLNRRLEELLQELRVATAGVQILFGFLLAVPFQQRFAGVTPFQRGVYVATLLLTASTSAFMIAPVAYHRILFRHGDKPALIRAASRFFVLGLITLALALTSAVLLVTDVLFHDVVTVVCTAYVGLLIGGCWFGIALVRRRRERT